VLKGIDWPAVSNNTSLVVPCYQLLMALISFPFRRDIERELQKKIFNSKVTSFYTGGIFVKNQRTYDGTGKLCTSYDKHHHSPPPQKKGWSHKSTQIKITIFHN
jgi:hypothetical protein